ncbi:MAG: glycosyltransferase family 4 protein [Candidatus Omnitrophica bacterium]|nr:glycosyltransferase family 4 protein [Candidatus Omnitrophota bacterium]
MDNNLRVIFYIESNVLGGCERAALERAIGVEELGVKTGVVCSEYLDLGLYKERICKLTLGCQKLPLKSHREYIIKAFFPSLDFKQIRLVKDALLKNKPDVLIVVQSGPDGCHTAIHAATSLKIPIIADLALISDPVIMPYKGSIFRYWWFKIHYRLCKAIITNCRKNEEILRRLGCVSNVPLKVIHYGIKYREYPSCPNLQERIAARKDMDATDNSWVLGAVGRLTIEKGHSWLIKAFGELLQVMPDAKLVIIGDGELYPKLKTMSSVFGDSVKFMGWREDVFRLYWGMDVFVLPSKVETNALVVLQAFAAGIPVIATNVHGMSEKVHDKENALLVDYEDTKGFISAMLEIRKNDALVAKMKDNAFKLVSEELEFGNQIIEYKNFIIEMLR